MGKETENKIFEILDEIREKVTYTNGKVARAIKDIDENKKNQKEHEKDSNARHEKQRSVTDKITNKMYMGLGALGVISLFADKIIETVTK